MLVLSPTDPETFERPDAFCSVFRKIMELIRSADALMAFWRANQETVVQLRERYPQLKTTRGVHYAQLLGELYTQRLQMFAERAKSSRETSHDEPEPPQTALVTVPRRRDKEYLRYVGDQPCLVCGRSPAHAHHLRFAQPRAMGRKASDEYTVPLCAVHHRELHDAGNEEAWWQSQ